jgi:hypothetical protein
MPSFTRCCVFNFHCLLWRRFFFLATRYRQKHETQQSELVMKSSVVIIQVGLNLVDSTAQVRQQKPNVVMFLLIFRHVGETSTLLAVYLLISQCAHPSFLF